MKKLAVLCLFVSLLLQTAFCSWSQQYGDPGSTNHVKVPPNLPYKTGWTVKFNSSDFYSYSVLNPAVSEKGVIFVPLRDRNAVAAVDPSGERLWTASIGDSYNCPLISNLMYSQRYDAVFVGCGKAGSGNESHTYYFSSFDPATGDVKWNSTLMASEMSKLISISEEFGLLYFFRIPTPFDDKNRAIEVPDTTSCILYVSLKDGQVVTNKSEETCEYMWEGFMQTKVGFAGSNQILVVPYHDNGEILALDAKNAAAPPVWSYKLPSAPSSGLELSSMAFTSDGVVYGTFSALSDNNPKTMNVIFSLDASNGSVLFTTEAGCNNISAISSSPAVDSRPVAYISCGNQVIAIDEKGSVKWKSTALATPYDLDIRTLPPALNEKTGLLYFVSSQSPITVLSMETGHLVKTVHFPKSMVLHPPILVGDNSMYIVLVVPSQLFKETLMSLPQ